MRHWGRWLGKTPSFQSENIFEFWDGTKMRAYRAFWDSNAQWELPVICTNNNCKSYQAFPNPCMEILQGWDVSTQQYKFCWSKCSTWIVCAKQTKEVCIHDLIQMVFFWPTSLFFLHTGCFLPTSLFSLSIGLFFCPLVVFPAHWFVCFLPNGFFFSTVMFFYSLSCFFCPLVFSFAY